MTTRSSCLRRSLPRIKAIMSGSLYGAGTRGDARDAGEAGDGEPKGVGHMRWPRHILKAEQSLDAALDLRFARRAIARHGALDLGRSEGGHAHAQLTCREVHDTPSVAHENGRARKLVFRVEILHHEEGRLLRLDELVDGAVDGVEPRLERLGARGGDDTGVHDGDGARPGLEDCESGGDKPRIEAHDPQRARPRRWRRRPRRGCRSWNRQPGRRPVPRAPRSIAARRRRPCRPPARWTGGPWTPAPR